jgi:branched-chain amino acid transport system permease protein
MIEFTTYIGSGVSYGCVYALLALGLVLAYRTSGVFNLSFGAIAYVVALLYSAARSSGWPEWLALITWVLIFAPAMGVFLDLVLFRFVRARSFAARLISVLGIFIAVPPIAAYLLAGSQNPSAYPVVFSPNIVYFRIGGYPVNGGLISTVLATAIVLIGVGFFINKTFLGLKIKAAVESPRLLALSGSDSDRVSAVSWGLSTFLAGLAGVLLAPILHSIDPISMTALLMSSTAAAVIAGLSSMTFAVVASIGIGIFQELLAGYLPQNNSFSPGLRPSLPFLILLIVILLYPRFSNFETSSDPLSAVDPPNEPPQHVSRKKETNLKAKVILSCLVLAIFISELTWIPQNWVFGLTQALSLAIIFLSITVIYGIGGQISLCQASFAGIGAFCVGQLALHFNLPVIFGIFLGALLAGIIGILVALPSIRLGGLSLAILTLGFALLADNLIFPQNWAANGATGLSVARPELGPINFNSQRPMFVLVTVFLVLSIFLVVRIREGINGGFLRALGASQRAAEAIGINPLSSRLVLFAFAAFLAGLGGGIYAIVEQYVSSSDFVFQVSLVYVVIVLALGVYTVEGAIIGALAFVILAQAAPSAHGEALGALEYIIFGLLAVYFAIYPEGLVERQKRLWAKRFNNFKDRFFMPPPQIASQEEPVSPKVLPN